MVGDWVICHHPSMPESFERVSVSLLHTLEQQEYGHIKEEDPLFINDNDDELTYVGVCELLHYESTKEFLRDSKRCGPYIKSIVSKEYYLPTHIVDPDILSVIPHIYPSVRIKDDYYVSTDHLLKYYVWEKGTFCGKKGKKIRNFI